MDGKRQLFKRPTAQRIMKGKDAVQAGSNLVDKLLSLKTDKEYLAIEGDLIPESYFHPFNGNRVVTYDRTAANRRFQNYGPIVQFPGSMVATEVSRRTKEHGTPADDFSIMDLWDEALQHCSAYAATFVYTPIVGDDKTQVRVPFVEILDGAKLYAYASRMSPIAFKKVYDDGSTAGLHGGVAIVSVPSQTPKSRRYEFRLERFPVVDGAHAPEIAASLGSTHTCDKLLHRVRFPPASTGEHKDMHLFDAHSIAAYDALLFDHFLAQKENRVPLQYAMIPMPSQELAHIYDLLVNNTVILTNQNHKDSIVKPFRLNDAEIGIMLAGSNYKLGSKRILWNEKRDGPLAQFPWQGF